MVRPSFIDIMSYNNTVRKESVFMASHGCVCVSRHISRENIQNLMAGLEFVCIYVDGLLIISKLTFDNNLNQLQVVLQGIRRVGLKVINL